jgi:hypothetical protein
LLKNASVAQNLFGHVLDVEAVNVMDEHDALGVVLMRSFAPSREIARNPEARILPA